MVGVGRVGGWVCRVGMFSVLFLLICARDICFGMLVYYRNVDFIIMFIL